MSGYKGSLEGAKSLETVKNKGRILALLQYLYKYTDEEHAVTMNELIEILSQAGYSANRKTVKDDIDIISEAGFDIITIKSSVLTWWFLKILLAITIVLLYTTKKRR